MAQNPHLFANRHNGPTSGQTQDMLKFLDFPDMDSFVNAVIPDSVPRSESKSPTSAMTEAQSLQNLKEISQKNTPTTSYIGQGFYNTLTPTPIKRLILENPRWYTAYTPYQAEISQGRLEALLNFQTMLTDLTGLELTNASLLDEGSAAAEAILMAAQHPKSRKKTKVFVDKNIFGHALQVIKTRMEPLDLELVVGDSTSWTPDENYFACLIQNPGANGTYTDLTDLFSKTSALGIWNICGVDPMSLALFKEPGAMGANIAYGNSQRFGVPMGFGGPHAAFVSTTEEFKRLIPGRIVGLSKDRLDNPALRLALQTREQHIRRERATSNICTAQVLLAVMASMYGVYHGPDGLKNLAKKIYCLTQALKMGLTQLGFEVLNKTSFDTISVTTGPLTPTGVEALLLKNQINIFSNTDHEWRLSVDETWSIETVKSILEALNTTKASINKEQLPFNGNKEDNPLFRTSDFMTHPVFHSHQTETKLMRYIQKLESKDLSLVHSMIPLGSCTMKLNSASELEPLSWPEWNNIHPFVPKDQSLGYTELIGNLNDWLCEISGFAKVSFQPNAGSQGEYAGLLAIRNYHLSQSNENRKICLIPQSAHGTNPASAVMAGFKVVPVKCDDLGNIDFDNLKELCIKHKEELGALMITYPSTHGVFEDHIIQILDCVHEYGGQVYMDGANFNALVGLCKPGEWGVDVSHFNLHKTFCIPHGGGGPGVGPIGVAKHLIPFLPGENTLHDSAVTNLDRTQTPKSGPVTSGSFGSASLLTIPLSYVQMMGTEGLKKATELALLNANYIAKKLAPYYPLLFTNKVGQVAHECILDLRQFKQTAGITVEDVAKRLIDYGFHAPTMSWPVPGTLMIEPTESEAKEELDRFCEAMIQIRNEIKKIEDGTDSKEINVLNQAPHSLGQITATQWDYPYTREEAAYPLNWVRDHKFWSTVSRVDNAYGDRNLQCSCPPMDSYTS